MTELKTVTEITLDVEGECLHYLVSAKQGDKSTRYIKARIVHDGTDITVPSGVTVRANIRKPDGKTCYNECTWESNNYAVLCLTNQALAAAGTAYCDFELRDANDVHILSTQSFTIEVERSERNEGAIESSDELTALDKKTQEIIKETQNKANEAIEKANAATESANKAATAANNAAQQAKSTADAAAKQATATANTAAANAEKTASDAAKRATDTANTAAANAEKTDSDAAKRATDTANTAAANAEKTASDAADKANKAAETVETAKKGAETAATNANTKAEAADAATKKVLESVGHLTFTVNTDDGGLDITYTE